MPHKAPVFLLLTHSFTNNNGLTSTACPYSLIGEPLTESRSSSDRKISCNTN
jgi:hypothetical protein